MAFMFLMFWEGFGVLMYDRHEINILANVNLIFMAFFENAHR